MEKRIIQRICPGKPVRRIGCNGDEVKIDVIAKFLGVHLRTLKNYYPIIIIFDRERRELTSAEIEAQLSLALIESGHQDVDFRIIAADRTTENWILADKESLKERYPRAKFNYEAEGVHGKGALRKVVETEETYSESTTGVELFL